MRSPCLFLNLSARDSLSPPFSPFPSTSASFGDSGRPDNPPAALSGSGAAASGASALSRGCVASSRSSPVLPSPPPLAPPSTPRAPRDPDPFVSSSPPHSRLPRLAPLLAAGAQCPRGAGPTLRPSAWDSTVTGGALAVLLLPL